MAHADYDTQTGNIRLITVWNEKQLAKGIPGARWDAHHKSWRINASWASLVVMRGLFKDELTVGDALTQWSWELYNSRISPALALRGALEPSPDVDLSSLEGLYAFQAAGAQFMATAECGLLGDEPGSGKTVQIMSVLHGLGERDQSLPALVICPNSVKRHWNRHTPRWLPQATPYLVEGSAAQRRKVLKEATNDPTALVIINIESVRLFTRLAPFGSVRLKRCRECDPKHGDEGLTTARCEVHQKELNHFAFRSVIIDEAHRIKEPKALQTRAIWHMCHSESVRYRWGLTGTPIANHPGDLWSIMHAVAPLEYPTKSAYVDRYCLMSWNAFGGMDVVGIRPDTREEFFKLLDPRFRRMLKAIVLPQLPPKIREVRYAEMSPAQSKAYAELQSTLKTRLPDGQLLIASNQLVVKTRQMQFASATVSVDKVDPDNVSSWHVTMREPSPKLDVLEEVLDDLGLLTNGYTGAPVLIAAEHKDLLAMISVRLHKLNIRHGLITGDVAPIDRERALDDLNAGRLRALLFTGKAGGVGLDMSVADTLINVQRSWSLVDERQKEDRNHRIGSERHESVRIIDIITKGTVEEDQVTKLHEKMMRLDEITRDRAALLAANPNADTSLFDLQEERLVNTALEVELEKGN